MCQNRSGGRKWSNVLKNGFDAPISDANRPAAGAASSQSGRKRAFEAAGTVCLILDGAAGDESVCDVFGPDIKTAHAQSVHSPGVDGEQRFDDKSRRSGGRTGLVMREPVRGPFGDGFGGAVAVADDTEAEAGDRERPGVDGSSRRGVPGIQPAGPRRNAARRRKTWRRR